MTTPPPITPLVDALQDAKRRPPFVPVARVLVVDDNAGIHDDFRKTLCSPNFNPVKFSEINELCDDAAPAIQPSKFEITSAFQGKEGLAAVQEAMRAGRPFSVAFVDMRMPPGWDGVETAVRLWVIDPDLQVVICSACMDYSWEELVARLGTSDRLLFLKKPFDMIEVQQLAHLMAEKRMLLQQVRHHMTHLEETVKLRTQELVRTQAELLADITQRKQAESGLRKLSRAVEQSPVSIVITDIHGAIEYVNPKFCSVTGYSFEDVRGRNPRVLKSGEMPSEAYRQLWATISGGDEWRGEFHNKKKNGELYWESASISPIRDDLGYLTHFVAVKEDITEMKQAARRLAELKLNEEQARRALELEHVSRQSHFVAMVSHEFRTPLGVINTAAHLLDRYMDRMNDGERASQIREIQGSVGRMTQMMEDLLLHGEFETGRKECKPESLDVSALCRQLVSDAAKPSGDSPRAITCLIDPAAQAAFLDGKILRHILGNLLSNAVKYSSGEQPVTLEVSLVRDLSQLEGRSVPAPGDHLCLKVGDMGIGIPAPDLARIFESFRRAANVGDRPGSGLGLAIVKQCVDLHRGSIRIESAVGKGTTVLVWLPLSLPGGAEKFPQTR